MNETKKCCPHCGRFVALVRITRFPRRGRAGVYFETNCANCRRTVKTHVRMMGLDHAANRYAKKDVAKGKAAE